MRSWQTMDNKKKLPELLAPAGDMEALRSAIAAGADAIYFGTDLFNARIKAKNFSLDEAREAIRLCHAHGVKAFVTLNIAIHTREIPKMLEYVSALYEGGVDALIVSDLGVIRLIREYFPDLELHASTQAGIHNLGGVEEMTKMGISRVVLARELDRESIAHICKGTDTEIEIFVHGAHCMSMSGQCLMSYAMGGRSGNRGECAQPCRLPYTMERLENACAKQARNTSAEALGYPLSLKDMSLSPHITEIIDTGAASLKIEGRMKSKEYVGGVTRIWRELLDKRKNAGAREIQELSRLFSRQGFTDGYFQGKVDSSMLGVRSENDKEMSKAQIIDTSPLEKPRLTIEARFVLGEQATLTVSCGNRCATVSADIVEAAQNAPMSYDDIAKGLSKLGATPYQLGELKIEKSDNIIVRVSSLNALRREAIDKLLSKERKSKNVDYVAKKRIKSVKKSRSATFVFASQIPEDAPEYFDKIFIPIFETDLDALANGVYLPPIILDSEWHDVIELLKIQIQDGKKYALVNNISQISVVKELGFEVVADYRFNIFNPHTVDCLAALGVDEVILSPELTIPQARDISGAIVAYGKIPVMTTYKCLMKDFTDCKKCSGYLTDRTGAKMYCEGIYGHHSVIYNSVPVYMADKKDLIDDFSCHFIFSDETKEECAQIIEAYKKGIPTDKKIRRIAK